MFDYERRRATAMSSRAISSEMRKGNTTPNGGVYIEMAHLGPEKAKPAAWLSAAPIAF